jgi:hypothetical protein
MRKILNIVIPIIIITIAAFAGFKFFCIVSDYGDYLAKMENDLDSLKTIQKDKQIIKQTMMIEYPQLSEFEGDAYAELFYSFCYERYKVSWTIPAAIIGIESGWNPTLISAKKCRGLGQLSSAAANEGCSKYGISYSEGYTEWNDVLNLALSLDYYCKKDTARGDSFAIRAYVGGDTWPAAVPEGDRDKYIKSYAKDVAEKEAKISKILAEQKRLMYINKGAAYEYGVLKRGD